MTTARLPPRSQTRNDSSASKQSNMNESLQLAQDPESLLNALDQRNSHLQELPQYINDSKEQKFDPIEFLNQHYESERVLSQQLPSLRESVSRRIDVLNDRIANALQRQSETAGSTRKHVQDAKASCQALEHRILQVREKAALSERAVLEITADMKRLDCAKRHLQRTITTLKRLHMLVQAVEHLRITTAVSSQIENTSIIRTFPDYKNASHLVDAISELMQYFEAYTSKVQPMQVLCSKVIEYQENLKASLVFGFRVVAFDRIKALRLSGMEKKGSFSGGDDDENEEGSFPMMTPDIMQGGIMLIDALGSNTRREFIHNFCQDALGEYLTEFAPPSKKKSAPKEEKRVSSFKKVEVKNAEPPSKSQAGLDQIEKRFTWFLNGPMLSIKTKFPQIFPHHWNLQACLVGMFLQLVSVFWLGTSRVVNNAIYQPNLKLIMSCFLLYFC